MATLFLLCMVMVCFQMLNSSTINGNEFTEYDSYNDWMGAILQCDDYVPCVVNCYGFTACQEVDIVGPKESTLTINCNGNYQAGNSGQGCVRPTIYAQNSTELIINVYNDDHQFYGGTIYTPVTDDDATAINTYITCGIIETYTAQGSTSGGCLESQNIYSIHGFNSVLWTYDDGSSWSVESVANFQDQMHCGEDYGYSCADFIYEGGQLTCKDTSSPCAVSSKQDDIMSTTETITTTDDRNVITTTGLTEITDTEATNEAITSTEELVSTTQDSDTFTTTESETCDDNNRWDFVDCSDDDGPEAESILFDVSLNVCILDDRFTRHAIWNLFKLTYSEVISEESGANNACGVDLEMFYVEEYGYTTLDASRRRLMNDAVDCEEICDADDNEYGYSVSTEIGYFCEYSQIAAIYEDIVEIIDSGAFDIDFKNKFLGFSVDDDSICKKGVGSVQVTSAILRLRDENGDDLDVKVIYDPNKAQQNTIAIAMMLCVILYFGM